ncbi:hypothetical protein OIU84_004629 [Salix udensis]|uniref:Uncharacterized protein n=1 Tax=Salix udensis TaxID=889485 RepID=A0AAD6K4S0_9ROSI|nr:hypothetical protein OIU84_004629 [Salix udensis]
MVTGKTLTLEMESSDTKDCVDDVVAAAAAPKQLDVQNVESEAAVASTKAKKTKKKKRAASDAGDTVDTDHGEATDGVLAEYDVNEPTMGEKLARVTLQDKIEESPPRAKPPSADSVNILLKQALGTDDRALLFDCLYTQDEKVGFTTFDMLMLNFTYWMFT